MSSIFNLPFDKRMAAYDRATSAALTHPDIRPELKKWNYDSERVRNLKDQVDEVRRLSEVQSAEEGDQFAATLEVENLWADAKDRYYVDSKVARIAFKNNPAYMTELNLVGKQENSLDEWMPHRREFYLNILDNEEALAGMANFGIKKERLEKNLAFLDDLESANTAQEQEKGEAQVAVAEKNRALAIADSDMSDFVGISRLAFRDKPELLEIMGIMDPSD